MKLFIDIETIPAQRPDVMDEIKQNIKPPGTIKKPESIAAWMENESTATIEEAYRKTGLDGAYGQICVIGFAFGNGPTECIYGIDWRQPSYELNVLTSFYDKLRTTISGSEERSTCVIGHNVAGFDLRFMVQRSIVCGVQPHRIIASAAQAKPWESDRVYDTMIQWAGVGKTVSLDKLCNALSIETPKGKINGANVWDHVSAGAIDQVADYCTKDVEATRAVYNRMNFQ